LDGRAHLGLNAYLVYLAVPAAALYYVPKIQGKFHMLWPVLMPALVFLLSWLVLGRLPIEDRPTRGALLLACGLGNTSFVGFPLTIAYFGEEGLKVAVVCDQITFLLLSTAGVAISISHGEGERKRSILAELFRFPPFLGFLTALLAPGLVSYGSLPDLWKPLADTIVPVALFSVGAQLEVRPSAFDRWLAAGVAFKLLLAPAAMLLLLWGVGASGLPARVTVMEAGMASMATTSVLAVQYRLNTRLVGLLIGVGVPLSLLTSRLWVELARALL
jgi:predicted permease